MPWEKEFNRDDALVNAMNVFWQKGYENTAVSDLVKACNASRYGLYDEFGDKRGLYLEALDCYRDTIVHDYLGRLVEPDASLQDIKDYIERLISLTGSNNDRLGCLMCITAVNYAQKDKVAALKVKKYFDLLKDVFLCALANAKHKGELKTDKNLEDIAVFLLGLVQGGAVLARTGVNRDVKKTYYHTGLSVLTN